MKWVQVKKWWQIVIEAESRISAILRKVRPTPGSGPSRPTFFYKSLTRYGVSA